MVLIKIIDLEKLLPEENDLSLLLPPTTLVPENPESFVLSDVTDVMDVRGALSI